MSKADHIRRLFAKKEKPQEIAIKANTSINYVYNVRRDFARGGGVLRRFRMDIKYYNLRNPGKKKEHRRRNYQKGRKNDFNSGKRWTEEETKFLLLFKGCDRRLASKINRSVQAIQVWRSKTKRSSGIGP